MLTKAKHIVAGQKVNATKVVRSRELRCDMTDAEKKLWQHLRGNQINGYKFRRQQIIDGFIVDFYCHAAALIVEVDGSVHEQQQEYDGQRDEVLRTRGLQTLRLTNTEIAHDLEAVLRRIALHTSSAPSPNGEGAGGGGEVGLRRIVLHTSSPPSPFGEGAGG